VPDFWPALLFGSLLVVLAAGLAWFQWQHRRPEHEAETDDWSRRFAERRLRRRLQVSGLLGMIGALVILVDAWPAVRRQPLTFFVLVSLILLLTTWIALLAAADWLATQQANRRSLRQLDLTRQHLEQQLEAVRQAAAEGRPYPPPEWN
jgi:nicotinamide riboside transporter PnuC